MDHGNHWSTRLSGVATTPPAEKPIPSPPEPSPEVPIISFSLVSHEGDLALSLFTELSTRVGALDQHSANAVLGSFVGSSDVKDTKVSSSAADVLNGQSRNDLLMVGAGTDKLVFSNGSDPLPSAVPTGTHDEVVYFGQVDHFDFQRAALDSELTIRATSTVVLDPNGSRVDLPLAVADPPEQYDLIDLHEHDPFAIVDTGPYSILHDDVAGLQVDLFDQLMKMFYDNH